jgi:hypothetical protein
MSRDLAAALQQRGKGIGAADPVVAVLRGPAGWPHTATSGGRSELLVEQGIDCRVGEISDLTFRAGKRTLTAPGST